jgi:hypothetical protein
MLSSSSSRRRSRHCLVRNVETFVRSDCLIGRKTIRTVRSFVRSDCLLTRVVFVATVSTRLLFAVVFVLFVNDKQARSRASLRTYTASTRSSRIFGNVFVQLQSSPNDFADKQYLFSRTPPPPPPPPPRAHQRDTGRIAI